jgi:hypothetical protein
VRINSLVILLACAVVCGICPCISAQISFPTKVALDHETFSPSDYLALQQLADTVARTVDELIPGRMSEFIYGDILCYQVRETDDSALEAAVHAPITVSATIRYAHEPSAVVAGRTRIALYGVEPLRRERFVYQLAHELAHVKMGVRLDNYLIETLAVAVSHEVLIRMGMIAYLQIDFNTDMLHLPESVQAAYRTADTVALSTYWQSVISSEGLRVDDRPFQALGAALIRMRAVKWQSLLGVGLMNSNCPLNNPPSNYTTCPPDLQRMMAIAPILESLGYDLTPKDPLHRLALPCTCDPCKGYTPR